MVTAHKRNDLKHTGGFPPVFARIWALLSCLMMFSAGLTPTQSRADIVLVDAAGRTVQLAEPAQRIVLNDSLVLLSLALIDPQPVDKIAGWAMPQRIDRAMFTSFAQRFPNIMDIPEVGAIVPANAAAESILSAQPDLFIVNLWQPDWEPVVEILTRAGVPVIFLDGPQNANRDPAEVTAFSIELLGKIVGQTTKASEYSDFVRSRYRLVIDRLAQVESRPSVLIDAFAGADCCSSPGRSNRLTQSVELAGGKVVGADAIAGYDGRLNPEAVIRFDPDVYIGTGVSQPPVEAGLILGGDVSAEMAHASLKSLLSQGVRRELSAVRNGRAYAVSHQISISALSVLTFECFAKWTHPELFADIDPTETLKEINERFMAVPIRGTFWTEL